MMIDFLITYEIIIYKTIFIFVLGIVFNMLLRILVGVAKETKEKERLKDAREIYTKRKRQFEGNEKGWKNWRDNNYIITDIVEAGNYY